MASEDVIELGSSEDEAVPVPKKIKPRPNAMVHIPNKMHGLTIKPAKALKSVSVSNLGRHAPLVKVPQINANKSVNNGKVFPKIKPITKLNTKTVLPKIPIINRPAVNPINIMKKLNTAQLMINKIPSKNVNIPIKINQPKQLKNLPPSITVTRTTASKRKQNVNIPDSVKKKQKLMPPQKMNVGEVLTVELDDDETPALSSACPQWYLRPEDQKGLSSQAKNDKEPDGTKFIEITIEDSPIKPALKLKRTHEIGAELAITIDDSPVKNLKENSEKNVTSDEEKNTSKESTKEPHSRKKLDYPKDSDHPSSIETQKVEVEIEMVDNIGKSTEKTDIIVEIEESPIKEIQNQQTSTPKKNKQLKTPYNVEETKTNSETCVSNDSEFHPVYQRFINLCFQLENSEDMKKIVEKKIKTYYRQAPKEYTESEEFIDMVTSKILSMQAGPEKMYLFIKDIVDELNLQRKMVKVTPPEIEVKIADSDNLSIGIYNEYDNKRQRQIRKLEKTIKKLHRAVQKLEEEEVDFDDEDDSVYLLTERYKERMVRVHAKLCQLTNTKMPSEPRVQIDARPGQPAGPAKRLEKWINKKVPIGSPLPFPDFHDVLRCVREANREDNLMWNEPEIMEEARDLFTRCGRKLQRRRQENEWRLAASRITLEEDPAKDNEELRKKLDQNRLQATVKETELFKKYADRQNQLNLEAVEICDKEADESPVESEDDEPIEETTSLQNKDKRKERLRRLLQENSRKTVEEKENQPDKDDKKIENEMETQEVGGNKNSLKESEKKLEETVNDKMEVDNLQPIESKLNIEENIQALSDDSNILESDVDELHLLQKFYSKNVDEVNSSTLESSDSESAIAISDTLDSDSENGNKLRQPSDVISIENSSYSESETNKDISDLKDNENDFIPDKIIAEEIVDSNSEIKCSSVSTEGKLNKTNNEEYNESIEDILLASSDDEVTVSKDEDRETQDTLAVENRCVNLKDDNISIGETTVELSQNNNKPDKSLKETKAVNKAHIEFNCSKSAEHGTPVSNSTFVDKSEKSRDAVEDSTGTRNKNYECNTAAKLGELEFVQSITSVNSNVCELTEFLDEYSKTKGVKCNEPDALKDSNSVESEDCVMSNKIEYASSIESIHTIDSEELSTQNECLHDTNKNEEDRLVPDKLESCVESDNHESEGHSGSMKIIHIESIKEFDTVETLESIEHNATDVRENSDESKEINSNIIATEVEDGKTVIDDTITASPKTDNDNEEQVSRDILSDS